MSGCRIDEIEAYVLGELDGPRAAAMRAHVDACSSCAAELRAVRAERALFAARATHERHRAALPSFTQVLRRSRKANARPWAHRTSAVGLCLAAAAAVALFFTARGEEDPEPIHLSQRIELRDEAAPPEFSCYEGE